MQTINKSVKVTTWVVFDNDTSESYIFNTRDEAREFNRLNEGNFSKPRRYTGTLRISS